MELVEPPKYFRSRRVEKKDIVKPWLSEPRDPKEKWVTIIPLLGAFVGLILAALLVWDGWKSVINHNYCLVFEDDFSQGLNPDNWQAEIQLGGFGYASCRFHLPMLDLTDTWNSTETANLSRQPTLKRMYSSTRMLSSTSEQHCKTSR